MRIPSLKVRVLTGFILIILGVLPKALSIIITNLVFGFVILLCFQVSLKYALKRFLFIVPFFVVSASMLVLVDGYEGFLKAGIYSGRLLFVALILAFVLYKTTTESLLKVLHHFKVPLIFIELAFFTLRFTDVFKVEIRNMHLSVRSKGFQSGNFFSVKTVKIFGHLLGSMLVRSLQRSEKIYLGMQSRGYGGKMYHFEKDDIPKREWATGFILIFIMFLIQIFSKGLF